MDFCLVSAATINDAKSVDELDRDQRESTPLGVLCLASVLQGDGIDTGVVDLDRLFTAWLGESDGGREGGDFSETVAAKLADAAARRFGFSSISSSYPLTLRIATTLKRLRPEAHIVLGGPQASATAEETLQAFPAVDIVVRGEGELSLPPLIGALAAGEDLRPVAGVVFRTPGGIVRTPDSPLLTDLDSLPLPAFGALPHLAEYGSLPLEAGRGCPFACTFCSTSRFFRHGFRTKSARRLVGQILEVQARHGVGSFELVHDNFTVKRDRVVEFCEMLLETGARVTWSCSARTDCVDDDLLDLMRRAGCRGIFFGVESGSDRMQGIIRKGLDLEEARARIRHANRRKIEAAVALIAGFPEETMEDLGRTVHFFVDVLRYDFVEPQLSLLSPLAGTPIYLQHRERLILDDIVSDMAFQGFEQDALEAEMVAAHPGVFSGYYSIPTPWLDRRYVHELRLFLLNLRSSYRWLLVALGQITGDMLTLFSSWRAWRRTSDGLGCAGGLEAYYRGAAFRTEFLAFMREEVMTQHPEVAQALLALVEYSEGLEEDHQGVASSAPLQGPPGLETDMEGIPVRVAGVHVARVRADLSRVVRCLRRRWSLSGVPLQKTTVVTRERNERSEIVQLSVVSAELLGLCNGSRDVRAVADAFGGSVRSVEGVPGETACLVGLELLRKDGLIRIAPRQTVPTRRAAEGIKPGSWKGGRGGKVGAPAELRPSEWWQGRRLGRSRRRAV